MDIITNVLAAFGLSSSAGLNAYLPLLVVAVTARYSDLIQLKDPWTALENPWIIGVLVVLLVIEFFADKIPAVNHANDVIQTFVRPTAGAVLFAASTGVVSDVHPVLAAKSTAPAVGRTKVWMTSLAWLTAGTLSAKNSMISSTTKTPIIQGFSSAVHGSLSWMRSE